VIFEKENERNHARWEEEKQELLKAISADQE